MLSQNVAHKHLQKALVCICSEEDADRVAAGLALEKFLERALTSTLGLALREGREVLHYILNESVEAADPWIYEGEAAMHSTVGGPHSQSGSQRSSLIDDILKTGGGEDHCITLTKSQLTGQLGAPLVPGQRQL